MNTTASFPWRDRSNPTGTNTADRFYSQNNLQDLDVIGEKFTDEDLEAEFENLSKIYNQPAENVKNMFTQRGQVGLVKRNILMEKVAAFLLENAKIG